MISPQLAGDLTLDTKITEWLQWDQYEPSRQQIQQLVDQKQWDQLRSLLLNRVKFGTAGIRGKMEAGFARLNDLIVIQTCQGLAEYLLYNPQTDQGIHDRQAVQSKGVLIGYDGRHNSKRFAFRAASVFQQKNIRVYLYSKPVSTPYVPFGIRRLGCAAGIVITASHNPKLDNGVKVYIANGAQIISPADGLIQKQIEQNLCPWDGVWTDPKETTCPLNQVQKAYEQILQNSVTDKQLLQEPIVRSVRFAYTSLHGVGHPYVTAAFQSIGLKPGKHVFSVPEQQEIDPEFSTVHFPNPEEGAGVLDLSEQCAKRNDCQIIIANDPDTDRCCLAERQPEGHFRQLNGNEIGALLGWFIWHQHRKSDQEQYYMMSSTVSSQILARMAQVEGFKFIETLTGFKWMGNIADDLQKSNPKNRVLFAFEEAIGYMCNTEVLDKDGISAAVQLALLSLYVYGVRKSTLSKFLMEEVYAKYGYHYNVNSYYLCYENDTIKKIFDRIFHYDGDQTRINYPTKFGNFQVSRVRDLTNGYDSSTLDNKPVLPSSSSSFMITFYFDDNVFISIRTSGTEPKIKYYSEIVSKPNDKDYQKVEQTLKALVQTVVTECLQPSLNQLKTPGN